MLVILLLTLPAGLAAFELTYRGPLTTTLSPILYFPLGPGVGVGVADDIAYLTADIEDAQKKGIVSLDCFETYLKRNEKDEIMGEK